MKTVRIKFRLYFQCYIFNAFNLLLIMCHFKCTLMFYRLLLNNDCRLIALDKGRYYKRPEGLTMGSGPFVEALEYASGKEAQVVGKPDVGFFKSALQELDCLPEETVMIGDVRI